MSEKRIDSLPTSALTDHKDSKSRAAAWWTTNDQFIATHADTDGALYFRAGREVCVSVPHLNAANTPGTEPPCSSKTILLVDDSDVCRITTKWFLSNLGFTVESSANAEQALSLFDPVVHDIVITDNSMPGMTGAEMAHIIKLRSRTTPVLMYSSTAPSDRSCLDLVIKKPDDFLSLKGGVESLLANRG